MVNVVTALQLAKARQQKVCARPSEIPIFFKFKLSRNTFNLSYLYTWLTGLMQQEYIQYNKYISVKMNDGLY